MRLSFFLISTLGASLILIRPNAIGQPQHIQFLPASQADVQVIHHKGFSLGYVEAHEQASWVAYPMSRSRLIKVVDRADNFRPDPSVRTGSAEADDYSGSGYDRGHLAPAADMAWSVATMSESFFYSNMSPQLPGFNRGVWKRLEELFRYWAGLYDSLLVVTGPVLSSRLPTIGPNRVSVPEFYYKVLVDTARTHKHGIGFLLPNTSSQLPLTAFVVTIDSIERLTRIDFFHSFPDLLEKSLEQDVCMSCWDWTPARISGGDPDNVRSTDTGSTSTQCKGTTQSGNRCRNNTRSPSGYCHLHD
jgi:endonuclease G